MPRRDSRGCVSGEGTDAIVSGSGAIEDLFGQRNAEKEKQGMRWQGFLLDARQRIGKHAVSRR